MYSKGIIMGFLTKDPIQRTAGDKIVCSFTVALNNSKSDVCFMEIEVWGARAEFVMKYFIKGKPIIVEGIIRQNIWEKEGRKYSKHLIIADKVAFVQIPREESSDLTDQPAQYPQAIASIKADIKEIYGNGPSNNDLPF